MHVSLTVNGKVVIDESVQAKRFEEGPLRWTLDAPVLPGDDVLLDVKNEASVFYLMTEATLSERPPGAR